MGNASRRVGFARCCRCEDEDDVDADGDRVAGPGHYRRENFGEDLSRQTLLSMSRPRSLGGFALSGSLRREGGGGGDSPEDERSRWRDKSVLPYSTKLVPASQEEEREFMVRSFSMGTLEEMHAAECLLCLDTFTSSRPNAPSLCGCGVNRNAFHLECLLEWRRRTNKPAMCPRCESELFFDLGGGGGQAMAAPAAFAAPATTGAASEEEEYDNEENDDDDDHGAYHHHHDDNATQ